jgi:hypothetical protein
MVLVMQRLYLHRRVNDAEEITATFTGYLLATAYLTCLVVQNIIAPLIFTLEVMPTPLFNKIHVCVLIFCDLSPD